MNRGAAMPKTTVPVRTVSPTYARVALGTRAPNVALRSRGWCRGHLGLRANTSEGPEKAQSCRPPALAPSGPAAGGDPGPGNYRIDQAQRTGIGDDLPARCPKYAGCPINQRPSGPGGSTRASLPRGRRVRL